MIETNNIMGELKTYDEVINNLSYGNRWRGTIDKKLYNLDIH